MPTFCELIGVAVPDQTDGKSFLPAILGQEQEPHDYLYWEFPEYGGQQAVRKGKWKAVRQKLKEGIIQTELYDLSVDPQEQNDIAAQNPELVAEMEEIMKNKHQTSSIERFQIPILEN
ncbi:sulfatase/phosphatase domain-containing protein [uncultured Algoriphagus sp.]|nr:sulfatase/phosphatase domain-containing protein [uncultured Algoriphagus sp.]